MPLLPAQQLVFLLVVTYKINTAMNGTGQLGWLLLQVKLKQFLALMPVDDNEAAQVAANGGYF